uniref:Fatty acid hydroxylase domain-containing protein n=1 Tax=viral metagenome TaxID=1070528 RepID=A0A6C0L6T1_9ZZZZ
MGAAEAREENEIYAAMRAYSPALTVTFLCSWFLEPNTPLLQLQTGCGFIWFWAYFIHRLHHNLPSTGIFRYLNIHLSLHHSHEKELPRLLELIMETMQNAVWFGILYAIQEFTDVHLVPRSIVLLGMLVYTSVHVINYSVFGSEKHREQHAQPHVNYGPDFLDHAFGTNSDASFEDMSHFIPNSILSTALIKYCMTPYLCMLNRGKE